MSAALALAAHGSPELNSYSRDRLTKAADALLDRAAAAGEIRADVSPEDLIRTLVGMCLMHDQPGWQSTVLTAFACATGKKREHGQDRPSSTNPLERRSDRNGLSEAAEVG
jgi:hypothetical protein